MLWHEIGHGISRQEPVADLIAAVVTKQSLQDGNLVVQDWSDLRACHVVEHFDNKNNRKKYGWGCVDVLDYLSKMPEEHVLGISEEQLKNLRFARFDPLEKSVMAIGKKLKSLEAFSSPAVAYIAEELAQTTFCDKL